MYKNILLVLIIAFIAGCSKPKPETIPSWYTNIPTDYKLLYAVGVSDNVNKAKKLALVSLRDTLNKNIDKEFKKKNYVL